MAPNGRLCVTGGAAGPVPAQPAGNGPVCTCGRGPHPDRPGRCIAGHPLAGHGGDLSRRHGLDAATLDEVLAAAERAFVEASIRDDGGESEVPTRRRSLHAYRGMLHTGICQLSGAFKKHSMFDRRGRLRIAWLQRLEGLITAAHRLDGTLGLGRRTKPIESLDALLDRMEREAQGDGR